MHVSSGLVEVMCQSPLGRRKITRAMFWKLKVFCGLVYMSQQHLWHPITMEIFLICFLASLSDPKNIRKKFEKLFFTLKNWFFWKFLVLVVTQKWVPGTNLSTQTLSTRNKPWHSIPWYPEQTWSLNPLVPGTNLVTQTFGTRNKPSYSKSKYPEQTLSPSD